jgi:mono/diheme cytochrome c family protein
VACLVLLGVTGCIRLDMYNQPRYETYEASSLFSDGTSSRLLVEGTVPRGWLREDRAYVTGSVDDSTFVAELPFQLSEEILRRGQERYGIYCAVCHDAAGTGRGMVVRRGYKQPPSFHIDRLRQEEVGYFYDVISRGFATMPSYASQIPSADRWAIVAWVRALQRSQYVDLTQLPEAMRQEIAEAATQGTVVGLPGESAATETHGTEPESHE